MCRIGVRHPCLAPQKGAPIIKTGAVTINLLTINSLTYFNRGTRDVCDPVYFIMIIFLVLVYLPALILKK